MYVTQEIASPTLLLKTLGMNHAQSIYAEKGTDHNTEAEVEFRHCTALTLKHPYKAVLTTALC